MPTGDVAPELTAVCAGLAAALLIRPRADRRGRAVAKPDDRSVRAGGPVGPESSSRRVAPLLDLIAVALEVGLAPAGALAAVAAGLPEPERSHLRRALALLDLSSDTAWRVLTDDPVLGPLAQALDRSQRSGAPLAATVRGLADEARRENRATRLAEARRVGVRTAAPLGACFLPAFFLIAIVPTVIALMRSVL